MALEKEQFAFQKQTTAEEMAFKKQTTAEEMAFKKQQAQLEQQRWEKEFALSQAKASSSSSSSGSKKSSGLKKSSGSVSEELINTPKNTKTNTKLSTKGTATYAIALSIMNSKGANAVGNYLNDLHNKGKIKDSDVYAIANKLGI